MSSNTFHEKNWLLIPSDFLSAFAARQPIADIVQEILSSRVEIIPLSLGISLSTFDSVSSWIASGTIHLKNIPFELQEKRWIAHISYPVEHGLRNPWKIILQTQPETIYSLHHETRRRIEYLLQYTNQLKRSVSIRQISRQPKPIPLAQKPLQYFDKDGNKYYIYSPKIQKWLTWDIDTLHGTIRALYLENNQCLEKYRIIASYQIQEWKDKKIHLIGIDMNAFDNFQYMRKSSYDTSSLEHSFQELSKYSKNFILSWNTLMKSISER